ncbi:MAG: apolipoprotein N-acyltransferase [Acidobacteriota bacterium]
MNVRRWESAAAGVLSGLLFALAFPPHNAAILVPLALVPWIVALARESSLLRALFSGALFGMAFWCASVPWVSYVVTNYGGQSPVMGATCVVLLAVILAEWTAVVGWGTAVAGPPGSWRRFAAFPLLWAAAEHARSIAYGGFPWNLTGWALARRPIWTQTASFWGVYGVGLAVAAVSALVAAFAVSRRPRPLAAAAILVVVLGVFGAARLARPEDAGDARVVALIQPNLTEEDRGSPDVAAESYRALLAQGAAAAAGRPDLVVFPESAFPLYWDRSPRLRADLLAIAGACGCPVLFNDVTFEAGNTVSNAARIVTPGGLAAGTYRKVHLVPFGEYVPLPKIFFFARRISQEIGEFTAAPEPVLLRAGPFVLGVGVCYEIIYPPLSRRQTADGANLLATISNDSWYGRAGAQEQHFAGAILRSVENGRYLVRSAITGISGAADSRGRVFAELPVHEAGTLRARVRLLTERTAWTRWGHNLPFAADGAAVAMLIFGLARRRIARRDRAGR